MKIYNVMNGTLPILVIADVIYINAIRAGCS